MGMDKNIPEIRFKGFDGEWDEKTLGSLCLIGDIDHRMPESKVEGIPYLMTGDFIGINGLNFENGKLISLEDYEQLSRKIKPEYGDIIFARYASVGAVRYVETEIKFLVSYSCAILKTSGKSYGRYLFYRLQTNRSQNQIELDINTGSQRNIGIDSLKNMAMTLPRANEQTQIGNYFQKLDNLINQHQQKHNKLSSIKKAMLEKMFPRQGETIPEIRFKGFGGEWVEKCFSEIAIRVSVHQESRLLPCVEYEDIISGTGLLNKDIYLKKTFKSGLKFDVGDVLFGKLRPYLKNWILADFEGIAVGDFWVLRSNAIESTFLFYLIQTNKFEYVSNLSAGSKMPRSDWGLVSSAGFHVPVDILESQKIGNYFKKLDTLINQCQQQITKLNNIKRACLGKMFV